MKYFFTLLTLSFVLLIAAVPLYAQGKSDQAPGQTKKSKAVVGTVDTVSSNSVTVSEKAGNKKTEVMIDKTTKVLGQAKKEMKIGAIKLKDIIAYISTDSATATAGGKLKVKKIFVKDASSSAQLKRRAVQGVITAINGNVLTLAHQIQRDRIYKVVVTGDTSIKMKSTTATASAGLATSSATLASLAVGQRIVAVGDLNPDGGIIAKKIHVIPGKATGIFNRLPVATPSASLVASPSTTPSASVLPSATPSATPAL